MRDGTEHRDRVDRIIAELLAPTLSLTRITGTPMERVIASLDALTR